MFRTDKSQPYAKLDAEMFTKGGNEVLADLYEFFADDIGTISGEIAAGSKKFLQFINKIPGVKLATKTIPGLNAITNAEDAYSLLPLLARTGLFSFLGETAQETVQEFRGINEQGIKEIASSAGFKLLQQVVQRCSNLLLEELQT